ncbi:hypothetical protein K456DRAFT_1173311 [Colletotrichum gloeosporioides 23]|nr:hypothetical protein K456DRAFT_1173311 [Colletotrichum gloeosporioides 23]
MQRFKNPISTYLDLYTKYPRDILGRKTVHVDWDIRQDTVLTTWEISFNKIEKQMPEAAEILLLCSFFSPQDIMPDYFIHGSRFTELQVRESFSLLYSFSLIRDSARGDRLSIHPLIHLWARLRLSPQSHEIVLQEAIQILYNYGDTYETMLSGWHIFDVLSEMDSHSCKSSPEQIVGLFDVQPHNKPPTYNLFDHLTGWTLWFRGYCNEAAWFMIEKAFGRSNCRLYDWEIIYRLTGRSRHTHALSWVLCKGMKVFPPKHPRILEIVGNYAYSLVGSSESARWYTWLLNARIQVLGPRHPATAGAYLGLGLSLSNCTDAIEFSNTAFDLRNPVLGRDDVLTKNAERILNETKSRCFLSECGRLGKEALLQKLMSSWRRDTTQIGRRLHKEIINFEIMKFRPDGPLASLSLIIQHLELEGRDFLRSWPSSMAHLAAHFKDLKASHNGYRVTEQLTHIWHEEHQETGLSIEPMIQMSQIAFYLAAWCMEARDVHCAESWLLKLYFAPQDKMSHHWHKKCTWPLDLYPRLWFEYDSPLKGDIEDQLSYWIDGAFWYLASSIMGQLAGFHFDLMSTPDDDFSTHIKEATLLFLLPGIRRTASTDLHFAEFLTLLGEHADDTPPEMEDTLKYWEARGKGCPGLVLRNSIVDNLYGNSLRDSVAMRSFKDSRGWYMCLAA